MDAGLSTMKNHNGPGYGGSSKLQMRNQLLQNDIGNIDVSQEVQSRVQPTQQFAPQGSQQYLQQQHFPPQNFPQQQYSQQQFPQQQYSQQQFPQHQYPGNRDSQFNRMAPQMGHPMPQNQQFQRGPARKDPHMSSGQPERRAYSLNQKSISSFFKNKGPRFSHSRGKLQESKEEDEEDTMLAEGEGALLTFNDLKSLGNKGGDRYGHGSDTAPMIPTIVTKEHSNMSNMEYRKLLTAQRKMAMNAVNKQNVSGPLHDGRAMSLQTYNSGSPLTQNRVSPYSYGQGGPPYNNSRANSLMRGPPNLQQQHQQKQLNSYPPHSMPGVDPLQGSGQRAMSLLTPQARPALGNMRPSVNAPPANNGYIQPQFSSQAPAQIYMQNGASSSSENFSRSNLISRPPVPPSSTSNSSNRSNSSVEIPTIDPSSSTTPENDHGAHAKSPLKHQMKALSPPSEKGHLSVLKLSTPQQNELIEKERALAQREKELREKELSIKEQEAKVVNALAERELEKLKLLRQEQQLEETRIQEHMAPSKKQNRKECPEDDFLNLNPLPILEAGLNSLSLDNKVEPNSKNNENRISSSTFVSTFSESPQKVDKFKNSSGMYKLEKSANNSVFVTASEFPNETEIKSNPESTGIELQRKSSPNTSTESINDGNSTLKGSIIPENDPKISIERTDSISSEMRSKKRLSFVKAKNFLRKMSSSSITKEKGKEKESHLSLKRSPSNVSIGSLPSSNNDTFHYKTLNRRSNTKFSANPTSSVKGMNDPLDPTVDLLHSSADRGLNQDNSVDSDPNEFVFDNTIGRPYQPSFASSDEVLKAEKFRTITIPGEQLNILNENTQLMQEITLVSMELAESIKRETVLESQLKDLAQGKDLSNENNFLSLAEFEIELRKKSAKIVELIQQLNDERLKRFIAEEQLLLQEHGVKPSSIELVHTIARLNAQLAEKDLEISKLKEEEYENCNKI